MQNWPGNDQSSETIPTRVGYERSSGRLARWGFEADYTEHNIRVEANWKLFTATDPEKAMVSISEAHRWLTDYLSCFYHWIQEQFGRDIPGSSRRLVAYVFSCSVAWATGPIRSELEESIRLPGFGNNLSHSASIKRTKPVAVAVSLPGQPFKPGDTLTVCDAGGGPTEPTCLQLTSKKLDFAILSNAIGSDLIDFHFERLLRDHLKKASSKLNGNPAALARQMIKSGRCESYKTSLGQEGQLQYPALALEVPTMSPGIDIPEAGIVDSKLFIRSKDMKHQFDLQMVEMFGLIDI